MNHEYLHSSKPSEHDEPYHLVKPSFEPEWDELAQCYFRVRGSRYSMPVDQYMEVANGPRRD